MYVDTASYVSLTARSQVTVVNVAGLTDKIIKRDFLSESCYTLIKNPKVQCSKESSNDLNLKSKRLN